MARLATILGINFRNWASGRGLVLVVAAAFFPLLLTGAWVLTHQADVAAADITWSPSELVEGQNITFHATFRNTGGIATGPFNASLSVGQVFGNALRPDATNTTTIDDLAPGATVTRDLPWVAKAGVYWVLPYADSEQAIGEREETNNQKPTPLLVKYATPDASAAPRGPADLGGDQNNTNATATDLVVQSLDFDASGAKPGQPVTLRATFANNGATTIEGAVAVLRTGRGLGQNLFPNPGDTTRTLNLTPGQSETLEFTWDAQAGAFWAEATIKAPATARDTDVPNNRRAAPLVVQPEFPADLKAPEPPEKATIKEFYLQVLVLVYLPILVPLVALFYAAGVLADDRESGNLTYLLTRPLSRWSIPVSKFLAGTAVAAAAMIAGLVLTYALLLGFGNAGDIGFLTTPLLVALVALVAYGALFTVLGVLVDRPYLVGVAFVLGWEVLAGAFLPWVSGLTVRDHVMRMICQPLPDGGCDLSKGWAFTEGVQWVPTDPGALGAMTLLLGAAVVLVVASAVAMKRKEFPG